jgi:hypothetical protein
MRLLRFLEVSMISGQRFGLALLEAMNWRDDDNDSSTDYQGGRASYGLGLLLDRADFDIVILDAPLFMLVAATSRQRETDFPTPASLALLALWSRLEGASPLMEELRGLS